MTWQPLERSTPYRHGKPIDIGDEVQWSNDKYVVTVRDLKPLEGSDAPEGKHISIRRQDRKPCQDWRDFQRIKNQLAGPEWEAIELYPAESRLVDGANQYHLWAFNMKFEGIGWNRRLVARQAQVDMYAPGAVQRDPESVDLQYGGLTSLRSLMEDNPPYPYAEEAE